MALYKLTTFKGVTRNLNGIYSKGKSFKSFAMARYKHSMLERDISQLNNDIQKPMKVIALTLKTIENEIGVVKVSNEELKMDFAQLKMDIGELKVDFGELENEIKCSTNELNNIKFSTNELNKTMKKTSTEVKEMKNAQKKIYKQIQTTTVRLSNYFGENSDDSGSGLEELGLNIMEKLYPGKEFILGYVLEARKGVFETEEEIDLFYEPKDNSDLCVIAETTLCLLKKSKVVKLIRKMNAVSERLDVKPEHIKGYIITLRVGKQEEEEIIDLIKKHEIKLLDLSKKAFGL